MVAYMRRNAPNMHVVMMGILPRGAWTLDNKWQWPNRMTAAINAVNTASQVHHLLLETSAEAGLRLGKNIINVVCLLPLLQTTLRITCL